MPLPAVHTESRIYSVSKLTKEIKSLLEEKFPFVWITGEISNLGIPSSGHAYFTLSDSDAQISAVMFRGQNRLLKFDLADGMQVTGLARINVYEPRGVYQLIFEFLEPKGAGALQVAFEQLKRRLAEEGLFDPSLKRPLPSLPRKIALVTSPTGAVVHDMIQVLERRFPGLQLLIVPIAVQGDSAAGEIGEAFELLKKIPDLDVAILARGGGSIEDLQAFNTEAVARAIRAASVPVVSAVGHETDFTIADFAADLRAPTPSAAAELVVPLRYELQRRATSLSQRLVTGLHRHIENWRSRLGRLDRQLLDPRKRIHDQRIRLDDLVSRLGRTSLEQLSLRRERLGWRIERLRASGSAARWARLREKLDRLTHDLMAACQGHLGARRQRLRELAMKLHALSPMAILARGYSITRTVPEAAVVRDSREVTPGQTLEILLGRGALAVSVTERANR
jgi:exodeoxyribonuclease VII large subunit